MGLLDAAGGRGGLASSLGGELLAGSLAPGGLASGLLGAGHGVQTMKSICDAKVDFIINSDTAKESVRKGDFAAGTG